MSQQYSRWQDFQNAPDRHAVPTQLEELRQQVHQFVIEQLGPMLTDQMLSEHDLRTPRARARQQGARRREDRAVGCREAQLIQDVTDDVIGYGPIDRFLKDDDITEVMVNGPDSSTSSERARSSRPTCEFVDETHLRRIIDKIVSQVGRRIDESTPMVDARLPDGSRVNAVVHPLAIGGPFLTIRKFARGPVHGRRPHQLRHAQRRSRALPRRVRARQAERHRQRRYRYR